MKRRDGSLPTSAGRNSRAREPLDNGQLERAKAFARRVIAGSSKILGDQLDPAPVAHHSGPQYWTVGTFADQDLEYTVQILVTRRRDSLAPQLLP